MFISPRVLRVDSKSDWLPCGPGGGYDGLGGCSRRVLEMEGVGGGC